MRFLNSLQTIGILLLVIVFFKFVPTIPQDLAYHNFADRRYFF